MRALYLSAALLAAGVVYVFSSTAYLSGFFSELLTYTDRMPNDPAEAAEALDGLRDKWKRGKPAVIMLVDRGEADGIDTALQRLLGAVESGDGKEYTAAVAGLRYEIEQIMSFIRPSAENVL